MDISILKIPWFAFLLWISILGDHTLSHPVPDLELRLLPSHSTLRTIKGNSALYFCCAWKYCLHNTSSSTALHEACPVSALSPSRSTTTTRSSQGLAVNHPGTSESLTLSGNNLRRVFLYLPCWRHPGQRGSTQCSEDNGPKLWTWRFFLGDSGWNSLLQQMKK